MLETKNTVRFEVIERKVTFFLELCAVFCENLICSLAEERWITSLDYMAPFAIFHINVDRTGGENAVPLQPL